MTLHLDDPITPEYRDKMNNLARQLDMFFNPLVLQTKQTAFTLLTAQFGDAAGRVNYISNADRLEMLRMMASYLRRNGWRVEEP